MARRIFYRNMQASGLLDIFLLSATLSFLTIRVYLHLTGYPLIGLGRFHIAHMLWGGLLMMTAITIFISFLGTRAHRLAVIVGGVGFGVFIDELGKFITRDNNYFFRPTIGLIYAIFVVLYLAFNFLSRDFQKLSSREYQLNALVHIQEAILHDMDTREKHLAQQLLRRANQNSHITQKLQLLVAAVDPISTRPPTFVRRLVNAADRRYLQFWQRTSATWRVQLFFLLEATLFLAAIIGSTWSNVADLTEVLRGNYGYPLLLLAAELLSGGIALIVVLVGASIVAKDRLRAFELFRRATLINIYLTEFFVFSREQWHALPGFMLNLLTLIVVSYVTHQERRLRADQD